MIKIQLKKNIGYLVAYFFCLLIRQIINMVIDANFEMDLNHILLYLMVLGEIMGGLLIYLYQYHSAIKKKEIKYFGIDLIYNQKRTGDGTLKRLLLLFLASFFDILKYSYSNIYYPKMFSECVDFRFSSIQTIASALIFIHAFKYKKKKHHQVSLIALGLCLCLSFIVDVIFKSKIIPLKALFFGYFLICFTNLCYSFNNCIEKYLFEADYMNPFKILLFEGLFGVIFSIFVSLDSSDPFKDIKEKKIEGTGKLILLISLLFLYFVLSMLTNAYKVYANIIFSPMTRGLIDYILNPLFNIYFFVMQLEFDRNYFFFFLSEIIGIIISFFGCVYNEYIILSCYGLDEETNLAIETPAKSPENFPLVEKDDSFTFYDDEGSRTISFNSVNKNNNNININENDFYIVK